MKVKSIVMSTLVAAIVGVQPATAQNKQSAFEEIVVTATKRSQSIYDVPAAISAFSAQSIEKQGISDLIDIGKFVPNLNVTNFGGGQVSSANPFIRGIGLQDHLITTDPGVGVYVDGVYLGRQLGQNLSLQGIERVEILRGPQGTLYGRNSIGGAINIITKKPGEENESNISFRVGSLGRVEANYYGNAKLSDTFAVSGSFGYKRREGVGDFTNLSTGTEVGEFKDLSGRISLAWNPTDNLSFVLAADANDAESGLGPYTTIIVPGAAVDQAGITAADIGPRYDNATTQADLVDNENSASGVSLTMDYGLSDDLNLKLVASTRSSDYTAGLDDDSAALNFLAFVEVGEADQTSFELQLNGTYENWDFVSGIYYFEEDGFNDQANFTFNGGGGSEFLAQETDSIAIYGNVGFNVNENLRIAAGLRYTEDEKRANTDLIFGFVKVDAVEEFDEVSWDLSATYKINDSLTGYASVANGFQSGQFNPRPFCLFGFLDFTQPGNVVTPNCFDEDLSNITALNYEVGIKGQLSDNLQMSLAVFRTEYSDRPLQVSNATAQGFNTVNLIVDQESTGVEWESSWRVADGFYINTSFGYIDAEVDSSNPFAVAPLTPEVTASISPEYTFGLNGGAEVTLRADYSYRDDMFGEPSSDPGRQTFIESRSLLNLDVSYRSPGDNWTVGLYGRNVTDEEYENARLNTGDYIIAILSNDAQEFGIRFSQDF